MNCVIIDCNQDYVIAVGFNGIKQCIEKSTQKEKPVIFSETEHENLQNAYCLLAHEEKAYFEIENYNLRSLFILKIIETIITQLRRYFNKVAYQL